MALKAAALNCNTTQPATTIMSAKDAKDRDLSEEEIADLKEAFSMFDINGDGELVERERERKGLVALKFLS